MKTKGFLPILLVIGALFYTFELVLHVFGLPILEHDKIFLPTHDRYIALYGLTYAVLLLLAASDVQKYKTLLSLTLFGIFLAMLNGWWISRTGGYGAFHVTTLDSDLSVLGYTFFAWYLITGFVAWRALKR